jgi:exonuclease V
MHSDYGSEIDTHSIVALSDYGSDIDVDDVDEDTLVGSVLEQIAARAPKTAVYPSIETQDTLARRDEAAVLHTPERPALRWAHSSPARRRRALVELEYDVRSRRAFSGMLPQPKPPDTS